MKSKRQLISCRNCTSTNVRFFLKVNNIFSLYKCNNCLIVFTYPKLKQLKQVNSAIYNSKEEFESRIANFQVEYQRARKHVLAFMKYKKSGKYLDIGCSYGISVKAAEDLRFKAFGIEPTPRAIKYAREELNVDVSQTNLEKSKFKSNSFDVISLYDVLEHIPNLYKFLTEIRRILKPKGLLVIQSPNINSFAFTLLKQNWNWLLVPNHLWHFSSQSITKILNSQGFLVRNIFSEDVPYDFSSNLTSKIFAYKVPMDICNRILRKIAYVSLHICVSLGSVFWGKIGKGGSLQVYAIKE